jgi:hypothetical protein
MSHKREDMLYDGSAVDWYGVGRFPASSGLSVAVEEALLDGRAGPLFDPQHARYQAVKDHGPIPAGLFSFPLKLGGTATAHMGAHGVELDKREGIEQLPRYWTVHGVEYENRAWGPDRVRLSVEHIDDPQARGSRTGGFYLHDSTKGYSHGCIEVDQQFFVRLRRLVSSGDAGRLYLRVRYARPDTNTRATP